MERALRRMRKPVVDVFYGKRREGFGVADLDNVAIGKMAAEHFMSRGFREFAYCGYNGINFSDVRRTAFARAVEQAGFACRMFNSGKSDLKDFSENVVKGERYAPRSDEAKAIRSWLRKLPKPIAVFCSHDLRAHQVLALCQDEGISVPQEVAILGVDDDAILCGFTMPTLSSIDPNGFETGREAVRIAREMLRDPKARSMPPQSFVKPLRLIVRESTEVYPIDPPWLSDALVFINRNAANGISLALGRARLHQPQRHERHHGGGRLCACRPLAHDGQFGISAEAGRFRSGLSVEDATVRGLQIAAVRCVRHRCRETNRIFFRTVFLPRIRLCVQDIALGVAGGERPLAAC